MAQTHDRSIRAAIPDTDAAVEYLRLHGIAITGGVDRSGRSSWTVFMPLLDEHETYGSDDVLALARDHMANV